MGNLWDMRRNYGKDLLELSGIDWIGDHFAPIGLGASPLGKKWWRRLKRWVSDSATRLPTGRVSFWAFPSALEKLKSGMRYYANCFDLSAALRDVGGNIADG
jgi:hypothetical protein